MLDPLFETFLTSRGLNSLAQKDCHLLVKNWIFGDPFHKKWPLLDILVPAMINPSGSGFFLRKLAFRGCWGRWGCRGHWGQLGRRGSLFNLMPRKSLLKVSESSRFFDSLVWGLYFNVLKKKIFWQNHQISCWILASFLSEAIEAVWGQKSFKWWIRHKFPLLRNPLSISFW